jgi:hypothetical protein
MGLPPLPPNQGQQAINCVLPSSGSDAFAYLTPDALMVYCESKLRQLDGSIQTAFDGQKMSNADQEALTNLANSLGTPPHDLDFNNADDFTEAYDAYQQMKATADKLSDPVAKQALEAAAGALHDKLAKAYDEMKSSNDYKSSSFIPDMDSAFGSGDDADDKIGAFFSGGLKDSDGKDIHKGGTSDVKLTLSDWQGSDVDGAIKDCQNDIQSSSELAMITLQSLMSQRQESIQMCTNLVQSLGDQCNKIAENIGH